MRSAIIAIFVIGLLLPQFSFATDLSVGCAKDGYTVSAINGIFTDEEAAKDNQKWLKYFLDKGHHGEKIDYQYLLNKSHLGGLGDIIDSIRQGLFDKETINDYDLVEMLKSASEKVATQKLLLVAHSQGNFSVFKLKWGGEIIEYPAPFTKFYNPAIKLLFNLTK